MIPYLHYLRLLRYLYVMVAMPVYSLMKVICVYTLVRFLKVSCYSVTPADSLPSLISLVHCTISEKRSLLP